MNWNDLKKKLKSIKNKRSLLLLGTILIGVISTSIKLENPKEFCTLISGATGNHTNDYFLWFSLNYVIIIILVSGYLIDEKPTFIDKTVTYTYLFFELLSLCLYRVIGWPEPKILIIYAFTASIGLYLSLILLVGNNE